MIWSLFFLLPFVIVSSCRIQVEEGYNDGQLYSHAAHLQLFNHLASHGVRLPYSALDSFLTRFTGKSPAEMLSFTAAELKMFNDTLLQHLPPAILNPGSPMSLTKPGDGDAGRELIGILTCDAYLKWDPPCWIYLRGDHVECLLDTAPYMGEAQLLFSVAPIAREHSEEDSWTFGTMILDRLQEASTVITLILMLIMGLIIVAPYMHPTII